MDPIATTPAPPYYAVIFTSHRRAEPEDGYEETADRMFELAHGRPGFLGVESVRDGLGLTISYWSDLDSIAQWKADAEHAIAQFEGRSRWYEEYTVRIARVEREYGFRRED